MLHCSRLVRIYICKSVIIRFILILSVSWKPTVLFEGQFLLTWTSYKVEIAWSSIVTQYVKFLVSATIVTLVFLYWGISASVIHWQSKGLLSYLSDYLTKGHVNLSCTQTDKSLILKINSSKYLHTCHNKMAY